MHPGSVFDIQTPWQSPAGGDPTDPRGPAPAPGAIGQFPPQAALEDLPEGRARFGRPLLRLDEQLVRQVDRGLHMGKNITLNMVPGLRDVSRPLCTSPIPRAPRGPEHLVRVELDASESVKAG
jgi:hypothetical protein